MYWLMMNQHTALLLFLLTTTCNATDIFADCRKTYTMNYGYKNFYHIIEHAEHHGNELSLRFWTQTQSDAHIMLASIPYPVRKDLTYEVILGGGQNTFSAIRSKNMTRSFFLQDNIVSNSEYRGFWINITKDGTITIGKDGDDLPILGLTDTEPLPIHYFSFGSWTAIVGKWIFSCPNQTSSEDVEPIANLTMSEKLRQNLLTHYDPYSRPTLNESDVTTVLFSLTCQKIALDEKKSVLSTRGEITMQWQDEKLRWNPQHYGNISYLPFVHHEIWQPELVLYNAVGHGTDILGDTALFVSSSGHVTWISPINIKSWCKLNLNKWPEDQYTCELLLGFWTQHEVLKLKLTQTSMLMKDQPFSSEWEVVDLQEDSTIFVTPWIKTTSDFSNNKAVNIQLTIQRQAEAYKVILVAPLILVGSMTILSFWLSPLDSNKILFSCISLVIMSMFLVALGGALPAPADHVPHLVLTYSRGMVALAIPLLLSVLVMGHTQHPYVYPLPKLLYIIIKAKPLQIVLLLPISSEVETTHCSILGTGDNSNDYSSTPKLNSKEIQWQWILLATVINRLSCLAYAIYFCVVLFDHI